MSELDCPPIPITRRSPARWQWYLAGGVLALACLSLGTYAYFRYAAERRLREAIAAVDAADPGWRLEDLEASRADIPDADNAALVVLVARTRLPQGPPKYDLLEEALRNHKTETQLTDEQVQLLRQTLAPLQPALTEAHKLAGFSTGRFAIRYAPDGYATLIPHVDALASLRYPLRYEVLLRAQERDIPGALRSCRALVVLGRALGDEPIAVSQFIRANCIEDALRALERTLAQGEGGEADLASLQRLFEEEMEHPGYLIAVRGERALTHRMLESIETGQVTVRQLMQSPVSPPAASTWERVANVSERDAVRYLHAQFLEETTEHARLARQPFESFPGPFGPPRGWRQWGTTSLEQSLAEAVPRDRSRFQYWSARLRCGIVLLAAERYRLAHGRWPEAVEELAPQFLARPMPDAYYGKPILLQRFADGLVVYSVGPDGIDDGGAIDPPREGEYGKDLGFRLWDVAKRRQPAPPSHPLDLPAAENGPK
jgi:hypothetical protein